MLFFNTVCLLLASGTTISGTALMIIAIKTGLYATHQLAVFLLAFGVISFSYGLVIPIAWNKDSDEKKDEAKEK